jgi:uncharacterized protein YecT (DUF1311 family)
VQAIHSSTTLGITNCILVQVNTVDAQANALQRTRFEEATTSATQQALLDDDTHWLSHRKSSRAAQASSGGTIDQINAAQCLLDASHARVDALTSDE